MTVFDRTFFLLRFLKNTPYVLLVKWRQTIGLKCTQPENTELFKSTALFSLNKTRIWRRRDFSHYMSLLNARHMTAHSFITIRVFFRGL